MTIIESRAHIEKTVCLIIKFLILLSLVFSSISITNASVTYNSDDQTISVKGTDEVNNISTLYSVLVQTYGENYTKENLLIETSPKKWECKKKISVPYQSDIFWINNTDVEELKIDYTKTYKQSLTGYIELRDVKLISWNPTGSRPYTFAERGGNIILYKEAHDVEFSNFDLVYFGYQYGDSIKDLNYTNLSLNNMGKGLSFQNSTNITVNNIIIRDGDPTYGGGITFCQMNDSSLSNITVLNASDYTNPATGAYGIYIKGGNNTIQDVYINGTAWSSSLVAGDNYTMHNITIVNSGHNGFETQTDNSYFENITVSNSNAINVFQIGHQKQRTPSVNNVYKNIYSNSHSTCGFYIAEGSCNTTVINAILKNVGFEILDSNNATLINCTQTNSIQGCVITKYFYDRVEPFYNSENNTIIDSILLNNSYKGIWVYHGNTTKVLNSKYISSRIDIGSLEVYHYVDIIVNDSLGLSVENTAVKINNECYSLIKPVNGYGKEMTIFPIKDGKSHLPNDNRANSPAIAEFYKDRNNTYILSYTAAITTQDGRTVSLSGITPDSSWYRPDPNIPTYTITAIIPDDSKGPHLTGFAPSRENPFNPGEKKNFRVWTDEPLTKMEWYVDGSDLPVSKGSLNYAWPVTEGKHTIKFVGSNANGTVSKVWNLGGDPNEPPVQEIKFSPADAVLTLNVSEKTVFSVSPDVFTTKEWYINGYPIQNNTTSMTRCWSTAGTRDVTFKGAGSGEPVSHTWTVNVVEEEKNDEEDNKSIIAIAPEYQIITPKQSFGLNILVDPSTAITGAQLDFVFDSSMVSANSAIEGNLFKQNGAQTLFSGGIIDKNAGKVKNIYGFIIGTSNVSSPGTMATVNLTAGNRTGIAEFGISNVLISNTSSKPVPSTITNATVLIDTAPVMNQICCPKSVDEKSTLTFKVGAKDADGDRLILSASGLPQGAAFNTTSGNFTWTPAVGQAGVYKLTFKVCDGYLTDSANVTVTVNKLNNLPIINFFEPLKGSFFSEGEIINISVNASDADGQVLNYSIRIDGVKCSTDPSYAWETDYSSSGNRTIEVAVSDGIDEVKEQHVIFINNYHPRWDVNEDGVVNILDITIIAQNYGTDTKKPYPRWDVNQDGVINIQDLTLAGYHFGEILI